jgi:hypothetical protein
MPRARELAELATSYDSGGLLGFRNRIINGDMRIDQRRNGASVTVNSGTPVYTLDRWRADGQSTDGVFTVQQSSVAPAGFTNSLLATVTTADASIGASQVYLISQAIEGFNVGDLDLGVASASPFTVSFWVRSSVTGTFGGALTNGAVDYSYPFTFSISAANTFEYKTVTVTGPTAGTWLTNNGVGLRLWFSLGTGSSLLGTAGSWTAAGRYGATGQTNLIATNGATFYITGVQLEAGSVATPFERRDYGRELAMCQRYYYRVNGAGVFGSGFSNSTTEARYFVPIPTSMRVAPSAVEQSGTANQYQIRSSGGLTTLCNSVPNFVSATTNGSFLSSTVASGLVAGQGILLDSGSSGAFLAWSAEL